MSSQEIVHTEIEVSPIVHTEIKVSPIVHTEIKVSPIVHNTDIPDSVITYLLFWKLLTD